MTQTMKRIACASRLALVPAALFVIGVRIAGAGIPCVEAVFFDLGDTLVENPGNGVFELRPGAEAAIADLQDLGVRLGIITNVPGGWDLDDLRAILAEPEFLDEFEVVILSSQAPAPKPNPAIYVFAHEALSEPRPPITSIAFVGETLLEIADREVDPMLGARSVGMIGIHLSDQPPSPLSEYTIPTDGLDHLPAIVEATCSAAALDDPGPAPQSVLELWSLSNPSPGRARLGLSLTMEAEVQLDVFDVQGRLVASLLDGALQPGDHVVEWDGRDADGVGVGSGVWYARVLAGGEARHLRFVTLR